jgi:hypothetical protein
MVTTRPSKRAAASSSRSGNCSSIRLTRYSCDGKNTRKDFAERFIKYGYVVETDPGLFPGFSQRYTTIAKFIARRARGPP